MLTPRAAGLGLVLCGLVVSAALPLRELLDQRGEIRALEQQEAAQRARVAELKAERDRLSDPAYVEAEARRRLHFVRPGEIPYILITPSGRPEADEAERGRRAVARGPWWSQLWEGVQAADAVPAPTRRPSPPPSAGPPPSPGPTP